MGLLSETEFKEKINTMLDNRVMVRLNTTFKIQPDIRTFPLYCNACEKVQPILYVHYGSRYGMVGSCNCQYCQNVIDVTDGDNIVTFIKTGGREIQFNELYLLDWNYIAVLGEEKAKLVEEALSQYQDEYITVTQLCSVVGDVLGIKDYPIKKYTTDRHYSILPQDINRWISLLDAIGVTLPDNVVCK